MLAYPELNDYVNVTESLGSISQVTGSLAAVADTIVLPLANFNGGVFFWKGVFTGAGFAFETSFDNAVSWLPVTAQSVGGSSGVTSLSAQSSPAAYEVYAPGATHIRLRLSAITTGLITVIATPFVFSADPAPSITGSPVLGSGTALVGDVGVQPRAVTGGFAAPNRLLSAAAGINATVVKASAGRVYKIRGYNAAAAVRYLKLYNKASAPVPGTDTPVVTYALKATDIFDIDLGSIGEYFSTGIAFVLTTGVADADTGALTAADIAAMITFYA